MRVVTWNINSLRLRLPLVKRLIDVWQPDIIALQETKCPDEYFPHNALIEMGYPYLAASGMKSYNGVAFISKFPLHDIMVHNRVEKNDCRHLAVTVESSSKRIMLHNLYIPAGGDISDRTQNDKFGHKLDFVAEMADCFISIHASTDLAVALGDFNIAPYEHDVWSHKQLLDVVSHTPIEVEHLARMRESLDWVDVARHIVPESQKLYSWWSYRNRDWRKSDRGRRLDHIWVTPALKDTIKGFDIHKDARDWPQPSDHVPVMLDLSL